MNKIVQFVKQLYLDYQKHTLLTRSGYKTDQNGIQKRLRREKKQWMPHLENTRNFILEAASRCNQKNRIAILGSGWLNDVPVTELSKNFKHVDLFDVLHPAQALSFTRKLKNVQHITTDLTGGLIAVADHCKTFAEFNKIIGLHNINIDLSSYDQVVSVNLLNQLDILLCDFLAKKFKVKSEELTNIRKIVQTEHIAALPLNKSCLITDYTELKFAINGEIAEEKKLVYTSFPNPFIEKEWLWQFDTHRLYDPKFNTTFKVKAIVF